LPDQFHRFKSLKEHMSSNSSGLSIKFEILIPKGAKAILRQELRKLGITHQSLFPGLDGIAKSIINSYS
jgi:hypothetical protein